MGHDYIEYGDSHVQLHDFDIWTLRHFVQREIRATRPADPGFDESEIEALYRFIDGWCWPGPGVVTGTDLQLFVQQESKRAALLLSFLERTIGSLKEFGETIPLEYLREHVNTSAAYFTAEQPTQRFIQAMQQLCEMVKVQHSK